MTINFQTGNDYVLAYVINYGSCFLYMYFSRYFNALNESFNNIAPICV